MAVIPALIKILVVYLPKIFRAVTKSVMLPVSYNMGIQNVKVLPEPVPEI
jgi:hypothetical protein